MREELKDAPLVLSQVGPFCSPSSRPQVRVALFLVWRVATGRRQTASRRIVCQSKVKNMKAADADGGHPPPHYTVAWDAVADVAGVVLLFLPPAGVGSCARLTTRMLSTANDNDLWRALLRRDFPQRAAAAWPEPKAAYRAFYVYAALPDRQQAHRRDELHNQVWRHVGRPCLCAILRRPCRRTQEERADTLPRGSAARSSQHLPVPCVGVRRSRRRP